MILVHKLPVPTTMDDSTNVGAIPGDARIVAGYVDGDFANFAALTRRFHGKADLVSLGIFADTLCDFIDVEPGNPVTTPRMVRASFELRKAHGVFKPGFYGDRTRMANTIIPGLAGIPESEWRLWLADWTDKPHIPPGFAACQYESLRHPNIDVSLVDPHLFFPPAHKPAHKPRHMPHVPVPVKHVYRKVHPKVHGAIGGGGAGVGIDRLLELSGVHLTTAESGAVAAVLAVLAAWLTPSP